MFVCKKNYQPIPNLSKESDESASIFFSFKLVRIPAASGSDVNCTAAVKYIVNMCSAYYLCMTFSIVSLVVWKVKFRITCRSHLCLKLHIVDKRRRCGK